MNHLKMNQWHSTIEKKSDGIAMATLTDDYIGKSIINESYAPKMKALEKMYTQANVNSIIDIFNGNIHIAIVKRELLNLASKGNYQALLRYYGDNNSGASIEELGSVLIEHMIELESLGYQLFVDNKLNFGDDFIRHEIYGCISNYLYNQATRHYERIYLELDSDVVAYNDVVGLSNHICIDKIVNDVDIAQFIDTLDNNEKSYFYYRLVGNTQNSCAELMGLSLQNIRTIQAHMRRKWEKYWDL